MGDGTTDQATTPVPVSGIGTASTIALGYDHSCAQLANGSAQCWGDNTYGQLGNGTSPISMTPKPVTGAPEVIWSSSDSTVATIDINAQPRHHHHHRHGRQY